jgi:predicted DNA binding CopG/RHH family protein
MKTKSVYRDAPKDIEDALDMAEIIEDFLPPPEELVFKEAEVRVTLNLNKSSVDFLKERARESGVPYQRMIRRIIDLYAEHYQGQ